jgi:ribosomal protein L37AE/L43A
MSRPDFPRTLREFQRRFADEAACRAYLAASRWPDGYRCPQCGGGGALELPTRLLWRCKHCRRDTASSATSRPGFEGRIMGSATSTSRPTWTSSPFRFNRRRTPMAAFQTLLGLGTQVAPTTYRHLYAVESTG